LAYLVYNNYIGYKFILIIMKKGFTLIELLVVIAIIGMLSSIVLSQLNNTRRKGANAAVKNNLANLRPQAELFYEGNSNSYNGLCNNTNFGRNFDAASQAGAGNTSSDLCYNNATTWVASVPLKVAEGTSNFWCVDSAGSSKGHANQLVANATVCP
jgi:prepilin-type N-terminal cleavage/methylation domain-containing protein